jgi:hypothetical protein
MQRLQREIPQVENDVTTKFMARSRYSRLNPPSSTKHSWPGPQRPMRALCMPHACVYPPAHACVYPPARDCPARMRKVTWARDALYPNGTRLDDDEIRSHRYPPRNGPAESEDLHVAKLKLLDLREEEAQARAEYLAILQRLAPSTVNG